MFLYSIIHFRPKQVMKRGDCMFGLSKKAQESISLAILGIVAVLAVVGLVMVFARGGSSGAVAERGQEQGISRAPGIPIAAERFPVARFPEQARGEPPVARPAKCVSSGPCASDADCPNGGRCSLGKGGVGKCDCAIPCTSNAECLQKIDCSIFTGVDDTIIPACDPQRGNTCQCCPGGVCPSSDGRR